MSGLIIRESVEQYIDASTEMFNLLNDFLTIGKEKGTDIDVLEARRIFTFMLQEDQKRENPHIGIPLLFDRHSWAVGEYAADLTRKIHSFFEKGSDVVVATNWYRLPLSSKEMEYVGGGHDIGKLLLRDDYQYAHEHLMWILLNDNGYGNLANLVQPHHPGSELVLKRIHKEGDFLDITEEEFCRNRRYPFASELLTLADMSCGLGYDGLSKRIGNIRDDYPATHHLVVGINAGEARVYEMERRVIQLLS